jgi:hypothetical protein
MQNRQKSYNYTPKREKLKKVVEKAMEQSIMTGKQVSKDQLAKEAGYKNTPNGDTTKAIPEMLEEIYPVTQQLEDHVAITREGDEQGAVKLKGHDMLYKLRGSYQPNETKLSGELTNKHELTDEERIRYDEYIDTIRRHRKVIN